MSAYVDGFVTHRGLRFHYLDWGDPANPPIVLLHGTTSNAHSWDKLCPILTRRYRCIALDWLNHGDSDPSDDAGHWDEQSEDVRPIVDAIGIETFGLIGLSMGGRAAMAFAAKWPERVNRLVIEDMAPNITSVGRSGAVRYHQESPLEFDDWPALVGWVRKARPYSSQDWVEEVAGVMSVPLSDGRHGVKYRIVSGRTPIDAASSERLWGMLPNISCPTLLLRGGRSRILDDAICQRMVRTIPDCRLETVPDAGHMIHEDNPGVTMPLITSFFGL